MNAKIFQYITPLRVFCVIFIILLIGEIIIYNQSETDPELGGLILIAYSTLILISGVFDLILSKVLKTKQLDSSNCINCFIFHHTLGVSVIQHKKRIKQKNALRNSQGIFYI